MEKILEDCSFFNDRKQGDMAFHWLSFSDCLLSIVGTLITLQSGKSG